MKKIILYSLLCFISYVGMAQVEINPLAFRINSPDTLSGVYSHGYATFGPAPSSLITADLAWAVSGTGDSIACDPVVTDLTGKIALVRRGACQFSLKVYQAQAAGAIGCILVTTNTSSVLDWMAAGDSANAITIPSIMISYELGSKIIAQQNAGKTINASLTPCAPTSETVYVNACNSYTTPSGDSTFSTPGLYTLIDSSINHCGRDSIITYVIDIESVAEVNVTSSQTSFCNSGSATISTDSSINGTNYYLRDNSDNSVIEGPIAGTNSAINFNAIDLTSSASYNVYAELITDTSALYFNGIADYVEANVGNDTIEGNFTVEAWVRPNHATATMTIVSTREPNDNGFDFKLQSGNLIHADIGAGSSWIVTNADAALNYVVGQWYHIAYVVTPTGYTVYVNGEPADSGTYAANTPVLIDDRHDLLVGSTSPFVEEFNGDIDEVRVWNIARTATEIADNYSNCNLYKAEGLVLNYKFNKGMGTATIIDESGSGYHGTVDGSDTIIAWVKGAVNCEECGKEMSTTISVEVNTPTVSTIDTVISEGESVTVGTSTYNEQGTYSDTLVNSIGCDSIVTTNLQVTSGVDSHLSTGINVYPNPTQGNIQLSVTNGVIANLSYKLYDLRGQLLDNNLITKSNQIIELGDFPKSIYLLKVFNGNQEVDLIKIVKK